MKLGAFSISLSVKDIHKSKDFYEKLGFVEFAGDIAKNYLIMKNDNVVIGLFQGMFEKNILTFNPGWNQSAEQLDQFDDVRQIQNELLKQGVELIQKVNEDNSSGPASITMLDPDGNPVLIDQHV